ncbi:MAG: hypothetical protein ACM3XZ_07555 [Betaproteobacteria bacterium]
MPSYRPDEEEEEGFPSLHLGDRKDHLRHMARRMASDYDHTRLSRTVGRQYIFLAALVAMLLLFGPRFRLYLPRQLWWLVPLALCGAFSLLRNRRTHR